MRRRGRPENGRQAGDNCVAPEEQAQAQHAVGGSENDAVQGPQAHVDERRRMQKNAPREDRPRESAYADPPAAGLPPAGVIERREHERAAERRRAIGRIRAEGFQDRALQRGPDCDGAGHPGARVARPASQKVRDIWRNAELLVRPAGARVLSRSQGGRPNGTDAWRRLARLRRHGERRVPARLPVLVLDHQPDRRRAHLRRLHQGLRSRGQGEDRRPRGLLFAAHHVCNAVGRNLCAALFRRFDRGLAHRRRDCGRVERLAVADLGRSHPDQKSHAPHEGPESGDGDPMQLAFFPLTLPFTTGPGTIAVAITLGAEQPSNGVGLVAFILGMSLAAVVKRRDYLDRLSIRRSP